MRSRVKDVLEAEAAADAHDAAMLEVARRRATIISRIILWPIFAAALFVIWYAGYLTGELQR